MNQSSVEQLTAADVMQRDVVWVPSDLPLDEVCKILLSEKISGAPVVDKEGLMVGVISLRDILDYQMNHPEESKPKKKTGSFFKHSWDQMPESWFQELEDSEMDGLTAALAMTPLVFSVTSDTPIAEVAAMMLTGRVHRLVVTENEELAGIITTMDMLKVVRDHLA